ncbi:hypothetical protein B398_00865 [Xylella fastidiosa 32]|uniref:Uncharacterized protein n=1 Tax=Xylella fastidiosa (strain 9a5c) TaxID=160492 RepID=Q9PGV0_XYLFA|nr:hypothetical protein XF_0198 [Xylella fastidiosa 9a5c]ACA11205.1 conserved hypothetical protein [Xylella fastidiosa M12]ETE35870.1 hypothetical protein B398_00865 [Xylella fastidiosa 32]
MNGTEADFFIEKILILGWHEVSRIMDMGRLFEHVWFTFDGLMQVPKVFGDPAWL